MSTFVTYVVKGDREKIGKKRANLVTLLITHHCGE